MSDGESTWALVVGIDRYDAETVPHLEGAVNDACAAVKWLRAIGVPDSHIFLHASPSEASRPRLEELGLGWKGRL